ncbi:MAG: ribonuclease D [Pelagibacteraceae bacterium TMED124]|nr:ribonuclease D [Rickettsiales bacterium]RPG16519.1 MAG: ribonuclease D [Pelagibacteraceae bacterium TMED124]|tara:strand:- start:4735 stop:5382 length:648 start_codon:yes stop_codon:yes gene_type:complete
MKTFNFGDTKVYLHKNDLPDSLKFPKEIAVDSETTGLSLIRDRLCLIQIATSRNECHLIKFEKIDSQKKVVAKNLINLFENQKILKIFHYARFDIAVIKKALGVKCENIFCTKIASKLVRTYTDKHGLKDLCKELLDKDLNKTQQSSDWSAEELSPNQIKYASNDVIFLVELKQILESMLKREGRYKLSQKLFTFLSTRVDLDFLGWNDIDIFSH